MSFRDLEGGRAGHGSKGQPRQKRDIDDSQFERTIKANIQQMQDSVHSASDRLQRGLASDRSVEGLDSCIAKGRSLAEQTEQAFRDWTLHLASEPAEKQRKKFSYEKLQKAFEQGVEKLRDVANRTMEKHREVRASEHSRGGSAMESRELCDSGRGAEDDEEQGLLDDSTPAEASAQELAVKNRIAQEREEGIRRIQSQVSEVNQIVRDLASICHEQGQNLCTIEDQAEGAADHTREATVQLKAAESRQGHQRDRLCCVLLTGVLALLLLVLPHLHLFGRSSAAPVPLTPVSTFDARSGFSVPRAAFGKGQAFG